MKHKLVLGAAIVFFLPSLACDSSRTNSVPLKTDPVTFVCGPDGGSACPPGTECPELPLGVDTCGDLPGLFGHPTTPAATGRPLDCVVRLSYGNPYYDDAPQVCICSTINSSASPPAAKWSCPN